jgi:hypothetical protein
MTITTANIDIGDLPNDGTGDPLRTAFEKINLNFQDLVGALPNGPEGSFQFNSSGESDGTANFVYVAGNNTITVGANILPTGNITIGTVSNTIANLYVGNSGFYVGNIHVVESGNTLSFPIRTLPSSKASFEINNLSADGNVTVGGSVSFNGMTISKFVANTANNSSNQIIFEYPIADFKDGEFKIQSVVANTTTSQYATVAVNKIPNNNGVRFSVYGTIFTGSAVTNYDVDVGYGNVRVKVSPLLNAEITHTAGYTIIN